MIQGSRKKGKPVLWTNWGLDEYDLLTIPPSFLDGFSLDDSPLTTFGSEMGMVNGTDAGRLLMRGSWNARPYGPLYDEQIKGVADGTDFYFNKNRLSGLWGAQTPLGLYLQENQITTLFFGGVNSDQCVWATFIDAYYKGYDVVWVDDIAATTSPQAATDMVRYNADRKSALESLVRDSALIVKVDGFVTNSSMVLSALA